MPHLQGAAAIRLIMRKEWRRLRTRALSGGGAHGGRAKSERYNCWRRHRGLDDCRRAGQAASVAAAFISSNRKRSDRRRRRSDPSPYPWVQRTARYQRGGVHGRDARDLQTRHRIQGLGQDRATATSTRSARSAAAKTRSISIIIGAGFAKAPGRRRQSANIRWRSRWPT